MANLDTELFHFLNERFPKIEPRHEYVGGNDCYLTNYDAYVCDAYYQHLKKTFSFLNYIGAEDTSMLTVEQKRALVNLATYGQKFIDALKEVVDQTTCAGLLNFPRLRTFRYQPNEVAEYLEMFKDINLLIRFNRNMAVPGNVQEHTALLSSLNQQLANFGRRFDTTVFDKLNASFTMFAGACIAGMGALCIAHAAIVITFLPVMVLLGPVPWGFLAASTLLAAAGYVLMSNGITGMKKGFNLFEGFYSRAAVNMTAVANDPNTSYALQLTRGQLTQFLGKTVTENSQEWNTVGPIPRP